MIIVQRRLGWKNKMILIILKHFIHMETLAFFYRTFSWHILWKFIFLWLIGNISANNLVKYYLPIVSKRPEPIVFFFPSLSLYTFFYKILHLFEREGEREERENDTEGEGEGSLMKRAGPVRLHPRIPRSWPDRKPHA